MVIELLVDLTNHKAGTKLNIENVYALRMIQDGKAKKFEQPIAEKVETQKPVVATPQPKRKGNPNWAKK